MISNNLCYRAVLLSLLLNVSYGFITHPQNNAQLNRIHDPTTIIGATDGDVESVGGIELVSLVGLGDDHTTVGETMGKSVAAWLDAEWLPQEVHIKMGNSVAQTYLACRSKGIDDVAEIMTQITDDLYEKWAEYNADAFVNAWDVGNYCADYLIAKSGSETCGCSTTIVE